MSEQDELIPMRRYLLVKVLMTGSDIFTATEAVYSTAIEHPEWNLDEEKTWEEWEKG
jgi:hypothetical protein